MRAALRSLHLLLISQRAVIALMEIFVFSTIVGWAIFGVVIAMWLLPTPVLRSIP